MLRGKGSCYAWFICIFDRFGTNIRSCPSLHLCVSQGWSGTCLSCHRLFASSYTNTQNTEWYTPTPVSSTALGPTPGGKLVGYPGAW